MTSGPPPSSFNYTTGSSSSSASKRNSLPASSSSSPAQGPRPLHLLDLAGSAQNSGSPSTASLSILSPTRSSLSATSSPVVPPSPLGKELITATPPPASATSVSGTGTGGAPAQSRTPRNLKRQSAISYFAPDHDSLREKELLLKRTSSPLHATGGSGGVASLSSPSRASGNVGVELGASSRSVVINVDEKEKDARPPVTLAEKHAELLHFIAQKEAKCLELRSQLAMHEEELLQLKRKWERIVNRGLLRENSSSSPSSSSPNLYSPHSQNPNNATSGLMSLTNPALALEGLKEGVQGMSRLLAAGLSITSSPVDNTHSHSHSYSFQSNSSSSGLGGGARPKLGLPSSSKSPLSASASASPSPLSMSSTALVDSPIEGSGVFGKASGSGGGFVKHAANESNSSSATTGTSTVFSAASASARRRLSTRSSSESLTSYEAEGGGADYDDSTEKLGSEQNDGVKQHRQQLGVPTKDQGSPQELMLSDTGATPTMSPNPAWLEQKARRRRRLQQQQQQQQQEEEEEQAERESKGGLGITPSAKGGDETSSLSDVSWDAWGDEEDGCGVDGQRHDRGFASASLEKKMKKTTTLWLQDPPKKRAVEKRASLNGSVAYTGTATTAAGAGAGATSVLASSIPTFGAAAESFAGLSALASPQMSSWMGSVGKKIGGEMKKSSDALTRSQKRASLMLSDMSQSLVSALTSPTPTNGLVASGITPSSTPSPSIPDRTFGLVSPVPRVSSSSSTSVGSHRGTKNHSSGSLSLSATLLKNTGGGGGSLIDDDDDGFGPFLENTAGGSGGTRRMPVMTPDVKVTGAQGGAATTKSKSRKSAGTAAGVKDEEDEWNW
ncbi:hypothetical protein MD484_g2515, partial [Candolleomyces efflorescens]